MKKATALLIVLVMLASFAGCYYGNDVAVQSTSTVQYPVEEVDPAAVTAQPTSKPAATPEEEVSVEIELGQPTERGIVTEIMSVDKEVTVPQVVKGDHQVTVTTPILYCDSDAGEFIYGRLEELEKELKSHAEETLQQLVEYAENDKSKADYSSETQALVIRSDTAVLSILLVEHFDANGVHPWDYYTSKTYAFETGDVLEITDVVHDVSALKPYILDRIKTLMETDSTAEYEADVDRILEEKNFAWTAGYRGLTVYLDAGSVLPNAAGPVIAYIPYAAEEDLFEEIYTIYGAQTEGHSANYEPELEYCFDLKNSGETDRIMLTGEKDNDDYYTNLKIIVNDQECVIPQTLCFVARPYFVQKDDRVYMYIGTIWDNDYNIFYIVELTGGTPVLLGTLEGVGLAPAERDGKYLSRIVFDPNAFELVTLMETLSTVGAKKTYHIGKDGMPESDDKYYFVIDSIVLTSKQELTLTVIDPKTDEKDGDGEYPAGSKFRLFRTDNNTIMDVLDKEGRIIRLECSFEYPETINDIDAQEAFEGFFYAG